MLMLMMIYLGSCKSVGQIVTEGLGMAVKRD